MSVRLSQLLLSAIFQEPVQSLVAIEAIVTFNDVLELLCNGDLTGMDMVNCVI